MKTDIKQQNNEINIATAKLKYLRISPRKVRLVANLIKHMSVNEAEAQLMLNGKRASVQILKLLRSCIANAKNKDMKEGRLFVKNIIVNEGPTLKRGIARAMGRSTPINKRTSHIIIELEEREERKLRFINKHKESKKTKEAREKEEKLTTKNKNKKTNKNSAKIKDVKDTEVQNKKTEIKKERPIKNINTKNKGVIKKLFRRKSV